MNFGFEPDTHLDNDLHPEDIDAAKFALPIADPLDIPNMSSLDAEQASFDAIRNQYGMEDLDNWWEKE